MNLIEFIGFLITMLAMTFLIFRRIWEDRRRRTNPEEFSNEKDQQEATLKQFLKSLDIDMEDDEEIKERNPPMPPPKPFIRQQQLIKRKTEPPSPSYTTPTVKNMAEGYHAILDIQPSKATRMINQLPSRKEMNIYQEIMNPPVSLR